jgi:cysteine desulfurase family protein (TIGR01976 family)
MNKSFRDQFPSLKRRLGDREIIYLDGPAGVQVPQYVIDAISRYYLHSNANTHGVFASSQETDDLMNSARETVAQFLGAPNPASISFGQNMTTLNFSLARAIGNVLVPGDEILITQLDHEGNRGPWLSLREKGIIVKEIRMLNDATLDYANLATQLNERTRLVAVGAASNLAGTVNNIELIRKLTYQVGAWLLVDAVHYAPHFSIDVQHWGCDFLLCSGYKFYGPHVGILYSKMGILDRLPTDRLRTAGQSAPESIETGTLNHAAIAGVKASIEFISHLGQGSSMREKLMSGMELIRSHESNLARKLYAGLQNIHGIKIIGPTMEYPFRAPTFAVYIEGKHPESVCKQLSEHQIFAWDGHFYALRAVEVLGLLEKGGVTRIGISAYTIEEEIDYTLSVFKKITS